MSVEAADFLRMAEGLHERGADEMDVRCAISRAYYAAFHDSQAWHERLSAQGVEPAGTRGGMHKRFFIRLENPSSQLPVAQQQQSMKRGRMLKSLHTSRLVADYQLDRTIDRIRARQAIADAVAIMNT